MNIIYSKDELAPLRLDENGARETLFAGDTKLVDDIMEGLDGAWDCVNFEKSTDVRSILEITPHEDNSNIYDIIYRCTGAPTKLLGEFNNTFFLLGLKDRTINGISAEGIGLRVFLFKLAKLGCEVILEFVDVNGNGQAWRLIFQHGKPYFYSDNSLLTNTEPGLKFRISGVEYGNKTLAQDVREKVSITYFNRYNKTLRENFGNVETYINGERVVMFDILLGFVQKEKNVPGMKSNEVLKDTLFRGVKKVKTTSGNEYRLSWSHAIHKCDDQTKQIDTHPSITSDQRCQSSIARKSLEMSQKDSGVFLDKSGRLSGIGNKSFGYTLDKNGDIKSARNGGNNLAGLRIIVENITPQDKLNSIGNEFKTEFSLPNKNENKLQSELQNPAYKELNREINKICKQAESRYSKLTQVYRGDVRRNKDYQLKNRIAAELNSKRDSLFALNPSNVKFDKNLDSKAGYKILPNGGVDSNQDKLLEVIINPESEFYKGSTNKPQANDSMVVKTIASTIESIRDMSTSDFNKIRGVDSE